MGNLLELSNKNYLLSEVHDTLKLLTNCIIYSGSSAEIIQLQKKIARLGISQGFFVPVTSIKTIFRNTPIDSHTSLIETYFGNLKYQKVNIMEVIASLITYSACSLEEKVKLALEVYDLDGNQVITKDEMVIMCISFMRGIGIMVQAALNNQSMSEQLADQAFYLADSNPDGMITYDE